MYGGKTTELLRRLVVCKEMGLRCCYINSSVDSRTSTAFSTHNKLLSTNETKATGNILGDSQDFIAALKIENISELISMIDQYDVFGIDEAQLFPNLLATVTQLADNYHKRLIVAGLNGTSERSVFGEILYLIPHANTIQKLEPFCKLCAEKSKITPAIFTKCMVEKSSTVMIGGKDAYVAVCRECYNDTDASPPATPPIYQSLPTRDSTDSTDSLSSSSSGDSKDITVKPLLPQPPDDTASGYDARSTDGSEDDNSEVVSLWVRSDPTA